MRIIISPPCLADRLRKAGIPGFFTPAHVQYVGGLSCFNRAITHQPGAPVAVTSVIDLDLSVAA